MDESWTVTKTVTPYFFWDPSIYLVKWVGQPEDVPLYDSSRGANPKLLFHEPPINKNELDEALEVSKRFGPEILEKLTDFDENLGGYLPAPPLVSRYHDLQGGDVQVREHVNYPRIVRASNEKVGSLLREDYEGNVVIKTLAGLVGITDEKEFKRRVVEFAEAYSPLNPYHLQADTLIGWRRATETADFWLNYFEIHSRYRFTSPEKYIPELLKFVEPHQAEEARLLKQWFEDMQRHDLEPKLESSTNRKREWFRALVGEFLFRRFEANLNNLRFAFSPHAFFVTCGSLGWMYREAWELNGSATLVKKCQNPRCNSFFIPKSKKKRYCNEACKQAAYNAREAAKLPS